MEADVGAVGVDVHLDGRVVVGEQALELGQGAGRNGDLQALVQFRGDVHVVDREAEAVGRGERHLVALETEMHAGQDGASVVGSRREDDMAQRIAQVAGDDLDPVALADPGNVRVGRRRHAVNRGLVGVGRADLRDERVLGHVDRDLGGGERRDEIVDEAVRDRDRAGLGDDGVDAADHGDLGIRRGQADAFVVGFEVDMAELVERVPGRHCPGHDAEPMLQRRLRCLNTHCAAPDSSRRTIPKY